MNELFYTELSRISEDIARKKESEESVEQRQYLLDVFKMIIGIAGSVRREGLCSLEKKVIELKIASFNQDLIKMLEMIMDCTDAELFGDICMTKYYSEGYKGYEALAYLLCMRGAMYIAERKNPYIIENRLLAILPEVLRREYEEDKEKDADIAGLYDMSRVEKLREEELPFKPADNGYLIAKLADCAIRSMDDVSIKRFIETFEYKNLLICMRGLSGDARAKIFDNRSKRQSLMMADDIDHQGPVIVTAVIDALDRMVSRMIALMINGIITYRESEAMNLIYNIYKEDQEKKIDKNERLREVFDEYRAEGRHI